MSGAACRIFSPSICRMMRSVVCVAGCCGPKLRVQRYSCSTGESASTRVDISTLLPRDPLKIMPLAAPAKRVIFPQRKALEQVGKQNPPQVGVPIKNDPEHVVDFAFHQ